MSKHKKKKKAYLTIITSFNSKSPFEYLAHRHNFKIFSIIFIVDNAVNIQIVNNKSFIKDIRLYLERCVAAIVCSDLEPEGIGTVITQITDDNGIISNITLENALELNAVVIIK